MKKFYVLLTLAAAAYAAPSQAQQLEAMPPMPDQTPSLLNNPVAAVKTAPMLNALDDATTIVSDWEACPGNWVYVSNYTQQTYPTTVRRRTYTLNGEITQTSFELTNALYGTAVLSCNPLNGRIYLLTPDNETGVEIFDNSGESTGKYACFLTFSEDGAPGTLFQYAASEYFRLPIALADKDASTGNLSYSESKFYDYFYNADARSAKIDIDIPRVVNGPLNLSGKCGPAATDLYAVLALSCRNYQLAEENPEYAQYGLPINQNTIAEILNEFIKTGKTNPAVKIQKIAVDQSGNFDLSLTDTWEGMRNLSLIAYKADEICDHVYTQVEMHNAANWKAYKEAEVTFLVPALLTDGDENVMIEKKTSMDINESAKMIRIAEPFSDVASDRNYIYIDYSLGMDKCFVTGSYTPATYSYTYMKPDFTTSDRVEVPYHFGSFVTANMNLGVDLADLYATTDFGWFFDLSAETPILLVYAQDDQRYMYTDGPSYVLTTSNIKIALSDVAGVAFTDNYGLDIMMGRDVAKVEFAFIDTNNPATRSQTFTIVNDGNSNYSFDLIERLIDNLIPKTVNAVEYTFFNRSDAQIKSDVLTTDIDFSVDFAYLDYEADVLANTSGYRRCSIERNSGGSDIITIYDFFDSIYFTQSANTPNEFKIELQNGTPDISNAYFGQLTFGSNGLCDVYAYYQNCTIEGNTIVGIMSWYVFNSEETLLGIWLRSNLTVRVPDNYISSAAISDVEADASADAPAEYFNLQGIRVAHPQPGNVYIRLQSGKATKIRF